ncbi:MAG: hypothetical protein K0R65_2115 [Crocinitomicaceae bacterium]|jgi:hypothetical protein|nr:hypothetical protein [Crocinitomicaceae bacterium]
MKKIIYSLIGLGFFTSTALAQEAFDKKMQFGIALGAGLNMNKTSTLLERSKAGSDFIMGLNFNYNINSTLTITSGLEFDFESFSYTPKDSVFYYYLDNEITKKEFLDTSATSQQSLFMLSERKYKANYLTIPVFVTLKTKPFGNMQYYGKFGSRISMKVGGDIIDKGYNFAGDSLSGTKSSEVEQTMVLQDDVKFLKINFGVAGGLMWNFSGTTMLATEIGYFFGLTQIHAGERLTGDDKKRSYTLIDAGKDVTLDDYKWTAPAAKQGQLLLKLTLFF